MPGRFLNAIERHRAVRHGFTLIELVVAVAVVGLLVALILPAVQQVRSTARRTVCANRLRQVALASQNYVDVHGSLPPRTIPPSSSMHVAGGVMLLFPYLDLPDISNTDVVFPNPHRFPVIQCPADGSVSQFKAPQSYVLNVGIGTNSGTTTRGPYSGISETVRYRDVIDGTSQTALFSERAAFWPDGSAETATSPRSRYRWRLFVSPVSRSTVKNPMHPDSIAERMEQTVRSIRDCLNGPRTFYPVDEYWLADWRQPSSTLALYAHAYPPNAPACLPTVTPIDDPFLQQFEYAASSAHDGGVHVAFMDGHVHFVSESIDTSTWRAIGTMNGGEISTAFE